MSRGSNVHCWGLDVGELHQLPDAVADDRRLVDMTWGELRLLVTTEMRRLVRISEDEQLPTAKEFAKMMRVTEKRVHEWCERGMPYIPTGNTRGKRIRLGRAFAWLEQHDG